MTAGWLGFWFRAMGLTQSAGDAVSEGELLTLAGDKLPIGTLVGDSEEAFADSQGDARHAEEHESEEVQ